MNISSAIAALVNERRCLSEEEAAAAMGDIMSGGATAAQIAALLIALRLKGETVDEITGMARAMREHALRVEIDGAVLDTCGTGGDAAGTFNVSTAAAFVAAGAGARVAKHGNRAMSSECGSADVLEALGARIDLTPQQVAECIRRSGFGFMFAQAFHPSMKHAAPVRKELGVRTAFNILGPLVNPAGARSQLLGVARPELASLLAGVLSRLGAQHALVVHGHGGVDELSLSGPSLVLELRQGDTRQYEVSPEDLGLQSAPLEAIRGGTPAENAKLLRAVLKGEPGAMRDVVVLNAAAALVAADVAESMSHGVGTAQKAIDSGSAAAALESFVAVSNSFNS